MSSPAYEFSEMICNPQAPSGPTPTLLIYCSVCCKRTEHKMAYQTETEDVWRCPICRNVQSFRVR